jgi:hypothetical protein
MGRKKVSRRKKRRLAIELTPDKAYQGRVVPIVGDGAMAGTGHVFGKLVPVVIVDATDRPDLHDVVEAHQFQEPGDHTIIWGRARGTEYDNRFVISLLIHFVRPVESFALLLFDLKDSAALVNQIVKTKYMYLQAGAPGDRLGNTLEAKRVLIQIPDTGYEKTWDKLLYDSVVADFRNRGLDKKESASAARMAIASLNDFESFRLTEKAEADTEEDEG